MSLAASKRILRAIPTVGAANLLLLAGLAILQSRASARYGSWEFAQRVDTLLYRMGLGALLGLWVWGWGLLVALLVMLGRLLPTDERLSRREIPGVAAVLLAVCFHWCWGLSEMQETTCLLLACVAFFATSGLWLLDILTRSRWTQREKP